MKFNYYTISIKGIFKRKYEIYRDGKFFIEVEKRSFFSNEFVFRDIEGTEIMFLKKPFALFKYRYEIYEENNLTGEITKESFSNKYIIDTAENHLISKTNITATEYTFYNGETEIAKGTRKIFSRENAYQLAIMEGYRDLHILATIIAISLTRHSKKKKSG